jgi:hypothetical protein
MENMSDYLFKNMSESPESWSDLTLLKYTNMATIGILYIEMFLCFGLNLLSISFIIISKNFTPINILIMNLGLVDIMYSSCIPFYVRQFSGTYVTQTRAGCQISYFLDVTCMIVRTYFEFKYVLNLIVLIYLHMPLRVES